METKPEERYEKGSEAAHAKSEPGTHLEGTLSEKEYRIMKVVAERKNGETIFNGIVGASMGMSDKDFNETLALLMAKGYIGQRLSEENKLNFSLSKKGMRVLERYADRYPDVKKIQGSREISD